MTRVYLSCFFVVWGSVFVTSCSKHKLDSGFILYLHTDTEGVYQLFQVDTESNDYGGTQITFFEQNILDFAISTDHQIALTLEAADGSHDIWTILNNGDGPRKLIECQESACGSPVWSPQGNLFIFERYPIKNGAVEQDEPALWWFDFNAQQAVPVFAGEEWYGQGVRFAADGGAISYFVPQKDEIQIYDLESQSIGTVSTRLGSPAEWGPEGQLYFSALFQSNIHIFKTNSLVTELANLSGGEMAVEDAGYRPSPDGQKLVFTRKPQRVSSGKQIMLMETDGSNQQSLTNQLDIQHGAVSWSTDGRQLVYQKFNLAAPHQPPTIWVMDVKTGESREIVTGTRPQWVP